MDGGKLLVVRPRGFVATVIAKQHIVTETAGDEVTRSATEDVVLIALAIDHVSTADGRVGGLHR